MSYLADIKQICRATEQAKAPHVAKAYQNIVMFKGAHFQDWSDVYGLSQHHRNKPKWRVEIAFNYFQTIALTLAAKLTMNRPGWAVKPATRDQDDRDKARLSRCLLDYIWEELGCQAKLYLTALQMILTGIGWWAVYWDRTAGTRWQSTNPESGEVAKEGVTGFPRIDPVLMFDIGIDPFSSDTRAAEWGYRIRHCSTEWAKKMWAKTLKGDPSGEDDELTHRLQSSPALTTITDSEVFAGRYVSVVEFYDASKEKFTIFAPKEGIILDRGPWKLPVPFLAARAIPNIGDIESGGIGSNAWIGETPMSSLCELQRIFNRSMCQLIEINNLLAHPRILAHTSARLNPFSLVDAPGSVVEYSGMAPPPTPFHVGQVSGWSFQMPERIKDYMHDVSGVHEASYGGNMGSIQSGRGIAIMAEQDATKFAPMARSLSEMIRQAAVQNLKMWRQFADGPATVRVAGRNAAFEVFQFYADRDITSTDVVVELGSTYAGNQALRKDQLIQMWHAGAFQDRRMFLRMMEFGDLDEDAVDTHRLKQTREIEEIIAGKGRQVAVKPWHDNYIHLDRLTEFMNSTTYDALPLPLQQQLEAHFEGHMNIEQQRMASEQQAAQQRGVASAGAPKSESFSLTSQPDIPSMGLDRQAEAFPGAGMGTMLQGGGLKQ